MSSRTKRRRPRTRAEEGRPRNRRWQWTLAGLGIGLGAIGALGIVLSCWAHWSRGDGTGSVALSIEAPSDPMRMADELAAAGLVGSSQLMALYLATLGRFGDVELGEHLLPANSSPRELAQCLARHPRRPAREVTIPEGFDHVRVAQRLEQVGLCGAAGFVRVVRHRETLERLAIRGRDAEGYLFPATYRFEIDSRPERILERLVAETRLRLRRLATKLGNAPFETLSASRGWGEFEILTLASIVEKEARRDDERAVIASVFFNRLDDESFRPRRMLQSDPTAAYGCLVLGDTIPSCRGFQHRILPAMLRDPSNPYNSYRRPGLPPGPIASPGEASIVAVLQPAKTDYLYFTAAGDGTHRFSRSFEEHDARVHGSHP